jgi:beta-glucanase (GH16 family)
MSSNMRRALLFATAVLSAGVLAPVGATPVSTFATEADGVFPDNTTSSPASCGDPSATWCDEFNGPADSAPDPAVWQFPGWACDNDPAAAEHCLKPSNALIDGNGNLVLKVTAPGTQGRAYDGVRMSTWIAGSWPPRSFSYATRPHARVEARIKYGGDPGVWSGFWSESVDPTYIELDISEVRLSSPTEAGCHVHGPFGWDGAAAVDSIKDWHVYAADYFSGHVTFYVDGQVCGRVSFPVGFNTPRIGLEFDTKVGAPGAWGGIGGPPSAPGKAYEADMLIDYVRVTDLPDSCSTSMGQLPAFGAAAMVKSSPAEAAACVSRRDGDVATGQSATAQAQKP